MSLSLAALVLLVSDSDNGVNDDIASLQLNNSLGSLTRVVLVGSALLAQTNKNKNKNQTKQKKTKFSLLLLF